MSATGKSNEHEEAVKRFLNHYKQKETQEKFEKLAAHTRKACEKILEEGRIKGVVNSRTKRLQSLEKKLKDMDRHAKFREVSNEEDIWNHSDMGDLAGVRIGLYLPDDVVKIAKKIEERFDKRYLFGTVTGERNTAKGRNRDIEQHGNGPWQTSNLRGDLEYWQHYGYKSWQIVIQWKAESNLPENLKGLQVEIQVGTVVTQAWAEVQHDIIYKRPAEDLATPSMKRIIDALNGLAITTETMLVELARSLQAAKKDAKRPFASGEEFWGWFELMYRDGLKPGVRERWVCDPGWNDILIVSSHTLPPDAWQIFREGDSEVRHVKPCRTEFAKIIQEKQLLKENGQSLCIARLLLKALGYQIQDNVKPSLLSSIRRHITEIDKETLSQYRGHRSAPKHYD